MKCWSEKSDSRPSFTQLSTEFTKMILDPKKFISFKLISGNNFVATNNNTQALIQYLQDQEENNVNYRDSGLNSTITAELLLDQEIHSSSTNVLTNPNDSKDFEDKKRENLFSEKNILGIKRKDKKQNLFSNFLNRKVKQNQVSNLKETTSFRRKKTPQPIYKKNNPGENTILLKSNEQNNSKFEFF